MSNDSIETVAILDEVEQLAKKLSNVEFIQRYKRVEELVNQHDTIQKLLKDLKNAQYASIDSVQKQSVIDHLYKQLMDNPLFSEYMELQEQVENFLKDTIYIFTKTISPNISINEKSSGGCGGGCGGCH
ncbi:hypothetical protein BHU72_08115 [Desulfuribacillus stibiiarsenatis]|uniref:YlbF family regulator n=1 Tax=Desulfuribacillus stibiiarsenatis TaxID=1390249 RepID=A0A1E5L4B8_9FIRM|nr:YlbF family regulator [Desulfuribacillus stibiiarsenatis]OEH84789.1 hypothetical protein BHU72_08115 [Desulfuribacillus stibiiarsenatis]